MRLMTGLCFGLILLLTACENPDAASAGDGGRATEAQTGGAAGSGGLAAGVYECSYNSGGMLYGLGAITIAGSRYGGFSGGMRGTYSMNAEGGIAFSDGFEGMPDGFRVEGTVLKPRDNSDPYIEVTIVSPSGNMLTVTCEQ